MTDDEALIALIDNELNAAARKSLLARLEQEEDLPRRLEALRWSRAQIVAGYESLLEQAPLARLRASLLPLDSVSVPAPPRSRISWRNLAAGLVVGLILGAAGAAAGLGFSQNRESDWRNAVVQYMRLYTPDTFAPLNPDHLTAAAILKGVGDKVGVALTPGNTAVQGLRFPVAFNLGYGGAPLAEVAYTNGDGEPVAFSVIANREKTSPLRTVARAGFSYVTGSRDGKGYVLVGRMSETQVAELARPLESRF